MFTRAVRKQSKIRLALMGPAGSGKTYSALQIAKGLGGRIAMIDTERGSGALYSHLVDFDVAELTPPFSPQKYIEAIQEAENVNYDVLIIDSLSHAWAGPGGILDIHDRVSKVTRNSFTAWREVTPDHNRLVDAMLGCACHVLVTLRTKTAYEVVSEGGKTKVAKIGLAPQQREGLEYEFTLVFDMSIEGHVASATKDRTSLFDGNYFTPTAESGIQILEWLHSGRDMLANCVPHTGCNAPLNAHGKSENMPQSLNKKLKDLGLEAHAEDYCAYLCRRYGIASVESLKGDQLSEQVNLLSQCKMREEKRLQLVNILNQYANAA
ncbi:MAG: ATP-binding protein [Solidesulfovibrio sp.]|uniref:ATP-binding protein n=1 Tax=Solidesulfovibrio sp. TaxID=2910990 RepID=UPI00315881A1